MSKITNQEDESAEKAFYRELDQKRLRRSCCTWQTFLIFFVILAILASITTIYLFYKIKQSGFTIEKLYPSTGSKETFVTKLKLDKEKNPTFSISITDQELTSVMVSGIKAISFEIKEVQVAIDTQTIQVYGKLTKPLKADIKIETVPTVDDGKIFLKVNKVSAGKLILPGFLNSEIEKTLNKLMDDSFQTLYENYQIERIELLQGEMIINGKLK